MALFYWAASRSKILPLESGRGFAAWSRKGQSDFISRQGVYGTLGYRLNFGPTCLEVVESMLLAGTYFSTLISVFIGGI
ncbi:MAG: hypothetical protein QM697_12105 [Lachnospiraceae bacterium]